MHTKELLLTYLRKIGFDLKYCGNEHYLIQDHNGINTKYMFWDTTITCKNENTVSEFKIEENNINIIEKNMLLIGNDINYVMFFNHDM